MNYSDVYNKFDELKTALKEKKEHIKNKNLEELNKNDETVKVLLEQIEKFDLKNNSNDFTDEQKNTLKELGKEIKEIQENNEILIKHSLDVINGLLSGILNITAEEKSAYDSKGSKQTHNEILDISSITEEA